MRYGELSHAVDAWVAEGLISREQAQAIRAREQGGAGQRRRQLVIRALALVGAVAGGLGVILFFAANWDAIARPARVGVLLAAIAGAYGAGYLLRYGRASHPDVGEALLVLGSICFGASLFLVGQMYHVQAHDPLALLLWSSVTLPTAAIASSRWLAALGLVTFSAWLVYEAVDVASDATLYVPTLLALYGAALYGLGTAWAARLGAVFTGPMRALGAVLLPAGVFALTFGSLVDEVAGQEARSGRIEAGLVALALVAVAGVGTLGLERARRTARWEALALAAAVALALLTVFLGPGDERLVELLLANAVMAALALGAILVGYEAEEGWLVNLGIALVGIDLFARYFDLFWDLLPRSFVFIGAGALLVTLAWGLERQRGRLLARMEAA